MSILTIANREIKLGFKNSWTYSFLILLTIFTITIFLLQSGMTSTEGYTDVTGTMLNMILYLLPLTTLLLGGVSAAVEKEDGHWELLSTYALSPYTFLFGKWIGLAVIKLTMLAFSFGIAGIIAVIFGKSLDMGTFLFFWIFSSLLALVYLSIALTVGAFAKNRWQALIGGISIWFITIVIWPILLTSVLSQLPYTAIRPSLEVSTFLNPAELIRVFSIIKIGAGSVFGPEYYHWINWVNTPLGTPLFIIILIIWSVIAISIGGFVWGRR